MKKIFLITAFLITFSGFSQNVNVQYNSNFNTFQTNPYNGFYNPYNQFNGGVNVNVSNDPIASLISVLIRNKIRRNNRPCISHTNNTCKRQKRKRRRNCR